MKSLVEALSIGSVRYGRQPSLSWKGGGFEPPNTGVRSWLANGTGYINVECLNAASGKLFEIECNDDSWAEANASDLIASREAAQESLFPRQHILYGNESVAWPLITCYYTAYFAVQAMLRCLGLGTVYLDAEDARFLTKAWNARGFNVEIDSGNYSFDISLASPLILSMRKTGTKGGVHQQFWSNFERLQPCIRQRLLKSPALAILSVVDRQEALTEYQTLIETMFLNSSRASSNDGCDYGWMSSLRNNVNYRFGKHHWLMNRRHEAGLINNHQSLIDRYMKNFKSLPKNERVYSARHMQFNSTRLFQIVDAATKRLRLC